MNIKTFLYCLLTIVLLSSCTQLKTLTSRDNSTANSSSKKSSAKKVTFLDDISVTPGHKTTTNHSSGGTTKAKKPMVLRVDETDYPAGDIERAGFLQLKYAIMLDASVEKLSNLNLLRLIDEWWGTRYCMGGNSKECIDCSAFVQVIMANIYNVSLPRTAQEQYNSSNKVGMENLKEGDLVFFNTTGRNVSHVGIYMLNNKFVHASTSGGVMFNDLNDTYWRTRYKGGARVTAPELGSR